VEAEVAAVHLPEPDGTQIGGIDAVGEVLGGLDRIVGQTEGACEHIGRPAWQHSERSVGAGDAGGHFVEGAVAPESDHDVEPATGGVVREPGGVSPTVGLDDVDVVAPAEAAMHDHGVARRHRRCEGIDHQQDPQGADGTNARRRLGHRVWALVDAPVTWGSL
jgi:hypothetical protein